MFQYYIAVRVLQKITGPMADASSNAHGHASVETTIVPSRIVKFFTAKRFISLDDDAADQAGEHCQELYQKRLKSFEPVAWNPPVSVETSSVDTCCPADHTVDAMIVATKVFL